MPFYTIPFLLFILLEFGIPLGIIVFCLASLFSAFKAAKNKNYGEAMGLSAPFALLVVGVAAFMACIGADIAGGAAALPRAGFDAGSKIALSLLDGVLSVLGPSGSALSGFAHKLVGALGGLLEGGVKLASNGLKAVGAVVGGGLGVAGAIGGGAIGAVLGGPEGALLGAAVGSSAVSAIMHAVEGLAGSLSSVLEGVAKVAGEAFSVVSGAIQAMADVLKDALDETMKRARSILQLSQASGWNLDTSSRAVQVGAAFGVDAGQLDKRNSLVSGTLGGLYGSSGDGGVEDLRAYRKAYRGFADQGPVGLMLAQNLEGVSNKGGYREAVNYDDATFEKQLQRQKGLSLDPSVVKEVGQGMKSLTDSIAMFSESIKGFVLQAFLPLLQSGLDAAINYWTKNKDAIIKGIFQFGEAVYTLGPKYLGVAIEFMTHMISGGIRWLADMAEGGANLLRGFDSGKGGILETVAGILTAIDYLVVGFKGVATLFAHVGSVISILGLAMAKVVTTILALGTGIFTWLSDHVTTPILAKIGLKDFGDTLNTGQHIVNDAVQGAQKSAMSTPFASYRSTQNWLDKNLPGNTDLKGFIDNLRNSKTGSGIADGVDAGVARARKLADGVDSAGGGLAKRVEGWRGGENKRHSEYESMLKPIMERIAGASERTADNTRPKAPLPGGGRGAVEALLVAISENLVESSYLQGSR